MLGSHIARKKLNYMSITNMGNRQGFLITGRKEFARQKKKKKILEEVIYGEKLNI